MGTSGPLHITLVNKQQSPYADYERIATLAPIVKEINHPHIVKYHQIVQNESQTIIIVEKLEAETLREFLLNRPNRRFPEDVVRVFFRQIVSAVECLHSNGIVHRNLNLESIFVKNKSEVKLGDYLICSKMGPIFKPNSTKSSYHFYAPEIWLDEADCVGPAADIW